MRPFLEYLFDLKPEIFAEDVFDDDCPLCRSMRREMDLRGAAH